MNYHELSINSLILDRFFAVHDVQALRGFFHALTIQVVDATVHGDLFAVYSLDACCLGIIVEADEGAALSNARGQIGCVGTNGECICILVEANTIRSVH